VQQVTNKNFVQGAVKMAGAISQPYEKTELFLEQYVSSMIPFSGLVTQTSAAADGYVREVNSVKDAIYNRVYGLRQGLYPKNDLWGRRIEVDEQLWHFMPLRVNRTEFRDDPVRYEFARLGMAAPTIPKKIDAVPGKLKGDVTLSDQERDTFSVGSGQWAYSIMKPYVTAPEWSAKNTDGTDMTPDIKKKAMFDTAFKNARHLATMIVLEPHREAELTKAMSNIDKDLSVPGIPRRTFPPQE
jgi:hypothetical protein